MHGGWIFLLVLLIIPLLGYGGWILYSRHRAQRLGLAPPSLNPFARSSASSAFPAPASGGLRGWLDTQLRRFKNRNNRSATGAYEGNASYDAGRGHGAAPGDRLDPDEPWDARVGNEGLYEETELGLHAPASAAHPYGDSRYGGSAYVAAAGAPAAGLHDEGARGRSRTRGYEEGPGDERLGSRNPFGDENAASLRGVSPRPLETQNTSYGGAAGTHPSVKSGGAHEDNSPTERRSLFREEI